MFFGVTLLTVIFNVCITAFISWSLYDAGFRKGGIKRGIQIVRTLRPIMFLANIPAIALTVAVMMLLNSVPALSWGWMSLLSSDGTASNVNTIGLQYAWFVPVFAILLIAALPYMAKLEEQLFREGTKGPMSALLRSLAFGLVHMVAGISLGTALALTIGGLWFTYQYKKGGVERSTAYHLAWNYTLVGILLLAIAVDFFI